MRYLLLAVNDDGAARALAVALRNAGDQVFGPVDLAVDVVDITRQCEVLPSGRRLFVVGAVALSGQTPGGPDDA